MVSIYGAYAYLGERQLFSFDTENTFHALTDASFDLRDLCNATGSLLALLLLVVLTFIGWL